MAELDSQDSGSPGSSFARLINGETDDAAPWCPRLLIVDDKPELLGSLKELLVVNGYQADCAIGGGEAMQCLRQKVYDVVLLDLIMPGVSGHDILDFARESNLECKIIVVSGEATFNGVKHALHCGAFDFVKKPYEAAELVASLETALRQCELERRAESMEVHVKESEALYRFIVNSSPDLVYMLDRDGCFTFLNERFESLLGYRIPDLIGKHYSEIIDDDHLQQAQNVFNERRTGERAAHNVELRLKSRVTRQGARFIHGQSVWMELTAMGIYSHPKQRNREHFTGTYGTARDISERKEAEQVINFQAYHDLLTHLPNRALLKDRLSLAITHARRNRRKLAVMFLDLDRFKIVNDTLGHTMGDRLLKAVSNRLQSCLRRGDTLSRFGGDEFTLLLPEVGTHEDVVIIARKILERLGAPFVIDGHELFVGASIGIAMYPEAGETEETLIQNADIAMYHIKGRGKNGFEFFSNEMNHQFSSRLSLERELRSSLNQGEICVFYQPQVCLKTGKILGVEALVRWQHPIKGLMDPDDFIPVAQETGVMIQIDEFVQRQAFNDVSAWRRKGLGKISLSVNISPAQLEQENFVEQFLGALESTDLPPSSVKVEITENTLMQDVEVIIPRLRALQMRGISVAIDDFGTGYCSLSYLQQFPVNTLKIDRIFVSDIRSEIGEVSIVNAIVAMAKGLKLNLIAEGVENRTQLRYLRTHGCKVVQGYIFSPPLPADKFEELLGYNNFSSLVATQVKLVDPVA